MTDNLQELRRLLRKHNFSVKINPVSGMFSIRGESLTAKLSVLDDKTGQPRQTLYWCPELNALVDTADPETGIMDAQEVCRWCLSENRGIEVDYGDC